MIENMRKVPQEGMVVDYYGNKYQLMWKAGNRWRVRHAVYETGYWMTMRQVAEACVVSPAVEEVAQ
jgi:hypothetical protein